MAVARKLDHSGGGSAEHHGRFCDVPSSGQGLTQTFVLQYSDSAGALNLATVWAVFGGSANNPAANTCAVYYNRSSNTLYLENDAANAASGAVLGTNTTLQEQPVLGERGRDNGIAER